MEERLIIRLSWGQVQALKILRDRPDTDGATVCKDADCSFDELRDLHLRSLIDIGSERLAPMTLSPVITKYGLAQINEWEKS